MKAWVLHNIGDFRLEDVPVPRLKTGEALIKVKCAGVCSSDIPRVFTSGAYHYPIILGHEFSGTVEDVYDRERDAHLLGKRVGVFPLIPCFKCTSCLGGEYETCCDYSYIGSRQDGAFAEYVAVPVWNLIELPAAVGFDEAAMLEPAAVALHAVKLLDLDKVNSAAVIGAGAIGRLIARWLSIRGVGDVRLIGRSNALPRDADACVEAVGSADALQSCISAVRPGGQIVLVGNPDIDFKLEQKEYWQILRKQLTVKGSWNSSFPADWQEAAGAIAGGSLGLTELITHRYPHAELGKALEMIRGRAEFRLKVMAEIQPPGSVARSV